jgi:hypothetical protein
MCSRSVASQLLRCLRWCPYTGVLFLFLSFLTMLSYLHPPYLHPDWSAWQVSLWDGQLGLQQYPAAIIMPRGEMGSGPVVTAEHHYFLISYSRYNEVGLNSKTLLGTGICVSVSLVLLDLLVGTAWGWKVFSKLRLEPRGRGFELIGNRVRSAKRSDGQ